MSDVFIQFLLILIHAGVGQSTEDLGSHADASQQAGTEHRIQIHPFRADDARDTILADILYLTLDGQQPRPVQGFQNDRDS